MGAIPTSRNLYWPENRGEIMRLLSDTGRGRMNATHMGVTDMAELPALVETMRQAINRQDFDGFIACFAPDGDVNDCSFRGPARIREWSDTELIGAKGHADGD